MFIVNPLFAPIAIEAFTASIGGPVAIFLCASIGQVAAHLILRFFVSSALSVRL